jgi:hypothetical protein
MNAEAAFFYSCAIVLTSLILVAGFGHCDQDTQAFKEYKICMEHAKDVKDCSVPK